ncbi:winged helix-turn-helix domain-containing protein [Enterovibrio sp. ZSDZ42]|uniref:Winged helix-turn-helix domain-containing protein n=1 Tax=Enterovibrio gelatinilyticus TaxID=2899819 RepID=A0ABT5R0D0_9GAMM|nr:winged helix-turn-helix domain-containing protein [Enterovibrio sp. ZSDZ42]MDD1793731.1 winged helix-turn-helix domain-containing protein [Enterovibrio sp. ZSDZ42]
MEPNITHIASLIADDARSKMLIALLGGKALTATELALEANITPQTASSHLAKLVVGDLLVVRKQGRHKYFQLANYQVAELLEQLMNITVPLTMVPTGPNDPSLRHARVCYDHLAGEVAVRLYDALVAQDLIVDAHIEATLTEQGRQFFQSLGADIVELEKQKRPLCKACIDWSERRTHLAGSLGKWLLNDALDKDWLVRIPDSRVVTLTPSGIRAFSKIYNIQLSVVPCKTG